MLVAPILLDLVPKSLQDHKSKHAGQTPCSQPCRRPQRCHRELNCSPACSRSCSHAKQTFRCRVWEVLCARSCSLPQIA